ncbi:hypothetical protein ABZY93_22025 [Streptomyces smyrnaeus]|uniref:hypothetical protein n=1 Tax=Streptomyces smyrnaeus TaxID=1387713 RepID=UPI0033B8813B
MSDEYMRKYGIKMSLSTWGNFRRRRGLDRRIVRNDDLIPWHVREEHRWVYPVTMLRVEARRRAGMPISTDDQHRLDSWKAMLEEEDAVVHYDPDTEDGFFYVPREPQDTDLIRRTESKTTLRPAADRVVDGKTE